MRSNNRRFLILGIAVAQFLALAIGVIWLARQPHRDASNVINAGLMAVGMITALGWAANSKLLAEAEKQNAASEHKAQRILGPQAILRTRTAILAGLDQLATEDTDNAARIDRVSKHVAILASRLADRDARVDADLIVSVTFASLLHEIGNAASTNPAIPPRQAMAAQDRRVKRLAARIGESAAGLEHQIEDDNFVDLVHVVAHSRNERWDGQGSPGQLRAEDIPLASRILALATLYDSLTYGKSRKDNLSHAEATLVIVEGTGNQLDPRVVGAFLSNHKRFETIAVPASPQMAVASEQVGGVALLDDDAAALAYQPHSVSS